jgi:hypothetical protein
MNSQVSTAMSSLAYELVCNPDIQQRLYDEIQAAENELDGKKVSYEKIQSLKYLDQCVSEILRKWTVAPVSLKNFGIEFITLKNVNYLLVDHRTSLHQGLRPEV